MYTVQCVLTHPKVCHCQGGEEEVAWSLEWLVGGYGYEDQRVPHQGQQDQPAKHTSWNNKLAFSSCNIFTNTVLWPTCLLTVWTTYCRYSFSGRSLNPVKIFGSWSAGCRVHCRVQFATWLDPGCKSKVCLTYPARRCLYRSPCCKSRQLCLTYPVRGCPTDPQPD